MKMTEELQHIEDSSLTTYIPPAGEYERIGDEKQYAEKWAEWGFSGKTPKKELWYKGYGYKRIVTIVGFITYGENDTLVIQFSDGNISCIFPAFLKEMQGPKFERRSVPEESESDETPKPKQKKEKKETTKVEKKEPVKKEKVKVELPAEKVSCSAKIKGFEKKYNHFTQEDEDVVLYEEMMIEDQPFLPNGLAWSSYSKTLQKLELEFGDTISFQAKLAANKFQDALCKINAPSKIKKENK